MGADINKMEEQVLFELGGFVQYCNDAQDLYKDLQNGMRTFATVRSNLTKIAGDLNQQGIKAYGLLKSTSYNQQNKDRFLFLVYVMQLGVVAKLMIMSDITPIPFRFDEFMKLSKQYVRTKLSPWQILKIILFYITDYEYSLVDQVAPKLTVKG